MTSNGVRIDYQRTDPDWRSKIPVLLAAAKQWLVDFDAALTRVGGDVDQLTVDEVNTALVRFTFNWARYTHDAEGLTALFGVPVTVTDAEVAPGYDDHSGPRQVLYFIGTRVFCKDARNISHLGWQWDEWRPVRLVTPTVRTYTSYE